MDRSTSGQDDEAAPLLPNTLADDDADPLFGPGDPTQKNPYELSPRYVLPLVFLAALAMSSAAATAYYAYATLLCKNPKHCEGDETTKYAKFVAITVSVSNILGMIALGPLQRISKTHQKLGLLLWMIVRSMSPVMLLLGVKIGSIYTALSGRIFDGLASDNLLHFTLNSIYAQNSDPSTASSLIGYSLALYMVGISTSPFVAGLFKNFTVSFLMALGLFAVGITYLQLCVTPRKRSIKAKRITTIPENSNRNPPRNSGMNPWTFLAPLSVYRNHPESLFCGLSLLVYNMVQAYTFNALLVYTSLKFGFSGKENGLLITIAHSVSATYIFATLYVIPRLVKLLYSQARDGPRSSDGLLAHISLSLQLVSLLVVGLATASWQIYLATALLALGLPTPSFIKAYFVGFFEGSHKSEALAALAVMEVMGDILGPVVLGGWQSHSALDSGVFFGAAGMVGVSIVLFGLGRISMAKESVAGSLDTPSID